MYPKLSMITKSPVVAFVFGASTALAVVALSFQSITAAQAQSKAAAWVITGELKTPKGNTFYRVEATEMKVICYTKAHADFSGGLSCVKK